MLQIHLHVNVTVKKERTGNSGVRVTHVNQKQQFKMYFVFKFF